MTCRDNGHGRWLINYLLIVGFGRDLKRNLFARDTDKLNFLLFQNEKKNSFNKQSHTKININKKERATERERNDNLWEKKERVRTTATAKDRARCSRRGDLHAHQLYNNNNNNNNNNKKLQITNNRGTALPKLTEMACCFSPDWAPP